MKLDLVLCLSCPAVFQAGAQISKGPSATSDTPLTHVYTYAPHAVRVRTWLFLLALGSSLFCLEIVTARAWLTLGT